jgi:hypothetical protein
MIETIKINFSKNTLLHILQRLEDPEKIFDHLFEEMKKIYPNHVPYRAYPNNDDGWVIELIPDHEVAEEFGAFSEVYEHEKLTIAFLSEQAGLTERDKLHLVDCYVDLRAQPVCFERSVEDFDLLGIPVYRALAYHLGKSEAEVLTLLKTEGIEVSDLRIALVNMEDEPELYFKDKLD